MAPAATTTKRPRPAFNPPRLNTSGISKSKTTKKSNIGSIFSDNGKKSRPKPKPKGKATPTTSKRAGVREQEPDDDDDDDDDEEQSLLDDDADASNAEEEQDDASDADMMLAEITHDPPSSPSSEPAIPIPLLHRLLHHSFHNPDRTKLSTDARASVGKYIEVFVREGIARCAYEVGEKSVRGGSDSALGHDDGWLEVEDLERVGGQLVLDF